MPSNLERRARRKRQTRLTFDPIDRSSSPAVRMSPAKVRYQLPGRQTPLSSHRSDNQDDDDSDELASTGKNRSTTNNQKIRPGSDGKLPFKTLPTPVKSSQIEVRIGSGHSGHIDNDEVNINPFHSASKPRISPTMSTSKSSRPYQGGEIDSSDGSAPEEEEVKTPSKRKRGTKANRKALPPVNYTEQTSEEEVEEKITNSRGIITRSTSKPSSSTKNPRQKSITASDDSDDDLTLLPPRSTRHQPLFKPNKIPITAENEDSDPQPMLSRSRRGHRKSIVEDDESEERPILSKPFKAFRSSRARKEIIQLSDDSDEIARPASTKRNLRVVVPQAADTDTDEEPITSPLKRKRQQTRVSSDSDVVSSPLKRRRPVARTDYVEEDDESDSDLPSPSKRSIVKRTSKSLTTPNRVTRQQNPRKHRTAKEKTMELLKRKRAGENISELTESEEDSQEEVGGIYDSGSELKALSEFEDEEESPEPERRSKPKPRRRAASDDDHYDSEFVVDDDEAPLGVPDVTMFDIPLEFTHAAHKPLNEHFKDVVEWMISNKINPGFERHDPVYRQAFRKLNQEFETLAMSKFKSSQWTNEFTKALNARPVMVQRELGLGEGLTALGEHKCDACNHRKHVPKYAISFQGKAYSKETLEEIERDSDSDSDDSNDEEDRISIDEDGHELPSQSKEWFTGRFCHENALQAHVLIHWRFSLNDWILDTLASNDLLTPAKLSAREAMSRKQRQKDANHVVDVWESNGLIKKLYRDFKAQLQSARDAKKGSGWGGNYL